MALVNISYDEPGEYELTYSATDSCGNTATATRQITVEAPTPTERLLVTGDAEEVCAFEGAVDIPLLTPVFSEPYTGEVTVRFTNFQARTGESEWTTYPTFESISSGTFVSSSEYSTDNINLNDGAYMMLSADLARYVYENSDDVRCAKWDTVEIWTKTE